MNFVFGKVFHVTHRYQMAIPLLHPADVFQIPAKSTISSDN